jgi:hypothetical protein
VSPKNVLIVLRQQFKVEADFNAMVLMYSDDEGSKQTKGEYDFSHRKQTSQKNLLRQFFTETQEIKKLFIQILDGIISRC